MFDHCATERWKKKCLRSYINHKVSKNECFHTIWLKRKYKREWRRLDVSKDYAAILWPMKTDTYQVNSRGKQWLGGGSYFTIKTAFSPGTWRTTVSVSPRNRIASEIKLKFKIVSPLELEAEESFFILILAKRSGILNSNILKGKQEQTQTPV